MGSNGGVATENFAAVGPKPTNGDVATEIHVVGGSRPIDTGEKRLNELGYKQELTRSFGNLAAFGAIVNYLTFIGILPFFGITLAYVGPGMVTWGWLICVAMVAPCAFSLAEICSAYPTAGSLYFWAGSLARPRWSPIAAWSCAWFQVMGSVVTIPAVAYLQSLILQSAIVLSTGTYMDGGYVLTARQIYYASVITMFLWCLLNSFTSSFIGFISILGSWWQGLGLIVFVILIPAVAPTHQSASTVFTTFSPDPEGLGVPSNAYCYIVAFFMSQFTLWGFDMAGHVAEETKGADVRAPRSIIAAFTVISVFIFSFSVALTFSIQGDYADLFDPGNATGGAYPALQVVWDAFYARYGSGTGALVVIWLVVLPAYFISGTACLLAASRIIYAVSRDHTLPYSDKLHYLHPTTKCPLVAVWVTFVLSVIILIPALFSSIAFYALTGFTLAGLVAAGAVVFICRFLLPDKDFPRGPFHLGVLGRPLALLGFFYTVYTTIAFNLPQTYPVTKTNFNYTPLTFGTVTLFAAIWWIVDARKWYTGPIKSV